MRARVRARGVSRGRHTTDDDVDDVHDYYDTAWGLHEDPLVGFWLPPPTLQSPAGNDISRDSVEGAPARRYVVHRRAPRTVISLDTYIPPLQRRISRIIATVSSQATTSSTLNIYEAIRVSGNDPGTSTSATLVTKLIRGS